MPHDWCRRSNLDGFSERFAALAFARFPEFEQHVVALREFQRPGNLYIEFPCPYPAELQRPMCVWTERQREIGVGLDACHTHFTCGRNSTEPEVFAEALSLIDDVFAERAVVISFVRDGRLAGSSFLAPDDIETEIAETPSGIVVRVRSWRGTYLRDHQAQQADTRKPLSGD